METFEFFSRKGWKTYTSVKPYVVEVKLRCHSASMVVIDQGLFCSSMIGLKLICWQTMDILNNKCGTNCDMYANGVYCLILLVKYFIFIPINFTDKLL